MLDEPRIVVRRPRGEARRRDRREVGFRELSADVADAQSGVTREEDVVRGGSGEWRRRDGK